MRASTVDVADAPWVRAAVEQGLRRGARHGPRRRDERRRGQLGAGIAEYVRERQGVLVVWVPS